MLPGMVPIVAADRPPPEITFVGYAFAAGSSVALPAHQAGDLIIAVGTIDSYSAPNDPSGWSQIQAVGNSTANMGYGASYKIAASSAETSGAWGTCNELAVAVYRSESGIIGVSFPQAAFTNGNLGSYSATELGGWIWHISVNAGTSFHPDLYERYSRGSGQPAIRWGDSDGPLKAASEFNVPNGIKSYAYLTIYGSWE